MNPIPEPPRQYRIGITATEAEGARQVLARGMQPPIPDFLKPFQDDAAALFSKLTGIVEAAGKPRVELGDEEGG
jgi:hypothetical protein